MFMKNTNLVHSQTELPTLYEELKTKLKALESLVKNMVIFNSASGISSSQSV
ncbi:hypothetical protein CEXT_396361, partial [Caerostris extrusa]